MSLSDMINKEMDSIAKAATNFYMKSAKGLQVLLTYAPLWAANFKTRAKYEDSGVHVPSFMIISINSQCNLHCAGCYARAVDACGESFNRDEMTVEQWGKVFKEASELGIGMILVLGGEPIMRKEVLEEAARHKSILFPTFTNGTLFTDENLDFFDKHRNLIPMISIEGTAEDTDQRRGKGTAEKIEIAMAALRKRNILFGASITTTTKNFELATDPAFIGQLREKGCGAIYYVEYIPMEEGTDSLMLSYDQVIQLGESTEALRKEFPNMAIYAVQGDENKTGGCLGAGKGFFHINAAGGAEPCPFSPHSADSMKDTTILEAIQSDFFKSVRKMNEDYADEKTDGCALQVHKDEVERLAAKK